jgi:hypothetical protein
MNIKSQRTVYYTLYPDTMTCSCTIVKPFIKRQWERSWNPAFVKEKFTFLYGNRIKSFFTEESRDLSSSSPSAFSESILFPEDALQDISIVKSLLQKAIRRQDEAIALSAAKTFMAANLKSFIRRLIIICAEDVFLDDQVLCTLVFLFRACERTAGEPFTFNKILYDFLLGVVRSVVLENTFEEYACKETMERMNIHHSSSVALSIFINSTDFFIPSDKKMLMWYHDASLAGTRTRTRLKEPIVPIDFSSVPFTTRSTCPLYAVDFHTHERMLHRIVQDPIVHHLPVRQLIWDCRSKLNKRKKDPPTEEQLEQWNLVKDAVDAYSRMILSSLP